MLEKYAEWPGERGSTLQASVAQLHRHVSKRKPHVRGRHVAPKRRRSPLHITSPSDLPSLQFDRNLQPAGGALAGQVRIGTRRIVTFAVTISESIMITS